MNKYCVFIPPHRDSYIGLMDIDKLKEGLVYRPVYDGCGIGVGILYNPDATWENPHTMEYGIFGEAAITVYDFKNNKVVGFDSFKKAEKWKEIFEGVRKYDGIIP